MPTKEPVVTRSFTRLSLDTVRVSLPPPRPVSELDVIERLRVLIRSVAARRERTADEPIDSEDEVTVTFLDDGSSKRVEAADFIGACVGELRLVDRRVASVSTVHEVLHVSDAQLLAVTGHSSLEELLEALMLELREERLDARWLEAQERVLDVLTSRTALTREEVLQQIAEVHALSVSPQLARDASWSVPSGVAAQVAWHAAVIDLAMRRATVRIGGVRVPAQVSEKPPRRRAALSSR